MKPLITLAAILLIIACGKPKNDDQLTRLVEERDSLKIQYKAIGKQLRLLDYQIAELDTAKKHLTVTTLQLERSTFEHFFNIRGNIEANKNTDLYPGFSGNIISIKVKEGDRVSKDQVLLVIDSEVLDNQIKQTQTSYDLAKTIYTKQKSLYDQQIGSEVQYLQAKNNMESLESSLAALKAQKKLSLVVAPYDGIVDAIYPKIGSMANPGMPVAKIVNLDKIYIDADVSESYIGKIQEGTKVLVTFPDINSEIETKITYAANFINPNNRTFKIKVDIGNTVNRLYKPNMICVLKVQDYSSENSLVLPASIIQQDSFGKDYVFITATNGNGGHIAKKVFVKIGLSFNGEVEVLEGLTGTETIIDKGARSVKDGQKIQIVVG